MLPLCGAPPPLPRSPQWGGDHHNIGRGGDFKAGKVSPECTLCPHAPRDRPRGARSARRRMVHYDTAPVFPLGRIISFARRNSHRFEPAELLVKPYLHFNLLFCCLFDVSPMSGFQQPGQVAAIVQRFLRCATRHKLWIVQRIRRYLWARRRIRAFFLEIAVQDRSRRDVALRDWEMAEQDEHLKAMRSAWSRKRGSKRRRKPMPEVPTAGKHEAFDHVYRHKLTEATCNLQIWFYFWMEMQKVSVRVLLCRGTTPRPRRSGDHDPSRGSGGGSEAKTKTSVLPFHLQFGPIFPFDEFSSFS